MKKLYLKFNKKIAILLFLICIVKDIHSQVPVAYFGSKTIYIEQYETLELFDSSSNNPTQWEWDIYDSVSNKLNGEIYGLGRKDGGVYEINSGDRFTRNPSFGVDVPGTYTVTLRCKNSFGWSALKVMKKFVILQMEGTASIGYGLYGKRSDNVIESEFGTIYDDGGSNLNYSNNNGLKKKSFLVIKPCNAKKIHLEMEQLRFADTNDVLYVYDGEEADYSKLLNKWTFGKTGNRKVTALSGSMYLLFKTGSSGTDSGFMGNFHIELDTGKSKNSFDFNMPPAIYNSVPFSFNNTSKIVSGVPVYRWTIDDYVFSKSTQKDLNYTLYTDGQYKICLGMQVCDEIFSKCTYVNVETPNNLDRMNFRSHSTARDLEDSIWLTPFTENCNRFEWQISPSSYILLNPPSQPSWHDTTRYKDTLSGTDTFFFKQRRIIYHATPGDSIPKPCIRFLDTVCYTIKMIAYNSLNPKNTIDTIIKTNYICNRIPSKRFEIKGRVHLDKDADCNYSGTDINLKGIPLKLYDSIGNLYDQSYSLYNGMYYFDVEKGSYTLKIDTSSIQFGAFCNGDTFLNRNSIDSLSNIDYGLRCKTIQSNDLKVLNIISSDRFAPGRKFTVRVNLDVPNSLNGNICSRSNAGGIVKVFLTGGLTVIEKPNATQIDDTLFYQISNFDSINENSHISFVIKIDTFAQGGDTIRIKAVIEQNDPDIDSNNNVLERKILIVNSYDPNMKVSFPERVDPEYEGWFNYTIHFQNTGNGPAYNVRLEDTLDQKLDISTFELLESSHENFVSMKNRVLKFNFNDIMLADSGSDEEGSKGHVSYRIRPVSGLQKGTKLYNTAFIFFDYNSPIVTNTTINEFYQEDTAVYNGIRGKVFYDKNANCIRDSIELGISNVLVKLLDDGGNLLESKYTDIEGNYWFDRSYGNYRIRINLNDLPVLPTCNEDLDTLISFSRKIALEEIDFGLKCRYDYDPAILSLLPHGEISKNKEFEVRIRLNKHEILDGMNCNFPIEKGKLIFSFSGDIQYKGMFKDSKVPSVVENNRITFDVDDLNSVRLIDYILKFKVDSLANDNSEISVTARIVPDNLDKDTQNNTKNFRFYVGDDYSSFRKSVSPVIVKGNYDSWYTYTISTRNNTQTSVNNVKITDTLDMRFDLNSIELTESSHKQEMNLVGNVLSFEFNPIELPSYNNEQLGSELYVQFRIKTKVPLDSGTNIRNTAYISMDNSVAERLNTITVECIGDMSSDLTMMDFEDVSIYPNPGSGIFVIKSNTFTNGQIKIYNSIGSIVYAEDNIMNGYSFDLGSQNTGFYMVELRFDNRVYRIKLIKE